MCDRAYVSLGPSYWTSDSKPWLHIGTTPGTLEDIKDWSGVPRTEKGLWMTTSKETGTSVLQQQASELCHQLEGAGKLIPAPSLQISPVQAKASIDGV